MASAWELKEVEHYSKLLEIIHHDDREEYESALTDDSIVEPKDLDSWDDDDVESMMQFNHEVYNGEILAFATSDAQLTQIGPVVRGGDESSFGVDQSEENQ